MTLRSRPFLALSLLGLSMFLITCGSKTPTTPVVTPSTTPPSTAPTPPPTTLPFGVSASCARIGLGDPNGTCRKDGPSFLPQLDAAIDRTVAKHPDVFDLNDQLGAGGYRILSLGRFLVGLLDELDKAGVCAVFDGEEIAIKDSQAFHDQYKVTAPGDHIRRGQASYRASCYPAGMPIPLGAPPPAAAGCKLPGSRSVACSREDEGQFFAAVDGAITELAQTHPEMFDFNDTQGGTDWFAVRNADEYQNAVADLLTKKGYCAIAGDELGVKNSNNRSEAYDILTGTFHVRRGTGSYRVSCYPADF